MASPPNTQLINGLAWDHSSIEIKLDTTRYVQIESIDWDDSLEPGKLGGAAAAVLSRSRGKYDANASIKMSLDDHRELIKKLGNGYLTKVFPIFCTWSEADRPIRTALLKGCRMIKTEDSSSTGGDVTMVTVSLHVLRIIRDGIDPLGKPGNIGTGVPV